MNIENLKYFYEAATLKSISKAAEKSHISQSALSKQIQRLEENLDVKLINRSNKGVELTDAGILVLKYAEKILHNYVRMEEEVKNVATNRNNVKINACCVLNPYITTKVIFHLKNKLSTLTFDVNSNYCDRIEAEISDFNADIGLVCKKPTDKTILCDVLTSDRVVLVTNSNLDVPDIIDFPDMLKYPIVMLNANNGTNETVKKKLESIGKDIADLKIVFSSDSTESVKAAVVSGQGIAFLPYMVVKSELENGYLSEIKVNDLDLTYDLYLIYNHDSSENIKIIVKEFKNLWKKVMK